MRLVKRHLDLETFEGNDIPYECLNREAATHMWRYYQHQAYVPTYGPQQMWGTIGDDAWNAVVTDLVSSVRELCIYYPKHLDFFDFVSRPIATSESILQRLAKHFYFKQSNLVCDYLTANHFLIPVLFEVRKKIGHYFGPHTLSKLELFTDPEDINANPKLFALILTALSSDDASTRLERLDDEWWLDQPREIRRVLGLDVDYIDGV